MNTKMFFSMVFAASLCTMAKAQQHVCFGPLHSADSPREDWILPGDTVYEAGTPKIYSGKPVLNHAKVEKNENVDYAWGLHKGLNMSVGLSAFATFGKNAPHSGGFTQTIDAAYLTPLTKDRKLWMALGAYVNNINYGGDSYHDGGLYGMLGYKINEHWEAYVYGQLSLANNYHSLYGRYGCYGPYGYGGMGYGFMPWGMGYGFMPGGYGMGMPGANVLGGGIRYTNSSKTFSIGLNIEGVWYDDKMPTYQKRYDYPVPKAPGK